MDRDRASDHELAHRVRRHQYAQPVGCADRRGALPPDRAGVAADPPADPGSRRHRHIADRAAAAPLAGAEDGKANAALLDLLAGFWRLPKRNLALIAGATSRRKLVHIAGDTTSLLRM